MRKRLYIKEAREGAPYGGTPPGVIVGIVSYFEGGTVAVRVLQAGTCTAPFIAWHRCQLDPSWLERYEVPA